MVEQSPESLFSARVEGPEAVVWIKGTLNLSDAPALRLRLNRMLDAGVRRLELDLSGVREIDRAGVAALFVVYKRLCSEGGALRFKAVSIECEHAMRKRHLFHDELDLYHVRRSRRGAG